MVSIKGKILFVSNAVETCYTENGHEILCTDDIITVMIEAINVDNINQNPNVDQIVSNSV